MPKAKTIKCSVIGGLLWSVVVGVQAQPVLGQVIDQTKQQKQKQLAPATGAQAAAEEAPPAVPTLWSITGINNQLVAEIWQGDVVYRVPLQRGAKLPSGWQVAAYDKQSVTLKSGQQQRKLTTATRGSTGWEYPQTPRNAATANASLTTPMVNSPNGRVAASNLPPAAMPPGSASSTQPPR
jgi:hypothetical protein